MEQALYVEILNDQICFLNLFSLWEFNKDVSNVVNHVHSEQTLILVSSTSESVNVAMI